MNPFSKFLRQWSHNASLDEFAEYWDRLERVVVRVYRRKVTVAEVQEEFAVVWPWLRVQYGRWEGDLRPFWQQTSAGGQPTQQDPFHLLLAFTQPKDILGDWTAMQHLPAAREALNQFILSQT
ncbi:MAG: hypothetical protein H6658_14410 [Ardenticatenaceae bacterium]|nr:hypothetical protein [Ardenticatenaceae bacterium]